MRKFLTAAALSLSLVGVAFASPCSDKQVLAEVYNQFWGPEAVFHENPAEKDAAQEKNGTLGSILGRIDCSVRVRGDRSFLRIYYHLVPSEGGRYRVTIDKSGAE